MTIKLIALDIDGTLLNPQHELAPANEAAVRAAQAQGLHIVLATGKQYPLFAHLVQHLNLTSPQISAHGAMITDPRTRATLAHIGLPFDLAAQAIAIGEQLGITMVVCRDGENFVRAMNKDTEYMLTYGEPVPAILPDLRETLDPAPTHLMAIAYQDDILFDRAERELKAALGTQLTISRSSPYFLEILHPAASKGNALTQVCEMLEVPLAETMAVGDSFNDISMFRVAGLAVAMGHAPAAVKAAAHEVTATNAEDGVARAIEKIIQ